MKKMMFALAAGAIALSGATAASADSFTPASTTAGFSGTVAVSYTIPLTCTMTATVVTNAAGNDANITASALTGGLCAVVSFIGLPWNVDVNTPVPPPTGVAATTLKLKGVTARTTTGTVCGPEDIIVNWNAGPPATITIPLGTEINPPTPGCKVSGTLTQVSGAALVVTN